MPLPRILTALALLSLWTTEIRAQEDASLIITGSDTMSALLSAWSQDFRRRNPGVTVEIQGSGSGAAPTALAEGTANIGAMTRPMSAAEVRQVVRRRGVLPTQLRIARDALAIVVHRDNPLDDVSIDDLGRIYSSQGFCSGEAGVRRWQGLASAPVAENSGGTLFIEPYGRAALSGAYGFFRQRALCGGDFARDVIELPGYAAIVDAVASIRGAIGYVGVGFVDERVKVLTVSTRTAKGVLPESLRPQGGRAAAYPLERDLYLYVVPAPGAQTRPEACVFLRYTQGAAARAILARQGFLPAGSPRQGGVTGQDSIDDLCA